MITSTMIDSDTYTFDVMETQLLLRGIKRRTCSSDPAAQPSVFEGQGNVITRNNNFSTRTITVVSIRVVLGLLMVFLIFLNL